MVKNLTKGSNKEQRYCILQPTKRFNPVPIRLGLSNNNVNIQAQETEVYYCSTVFCYGGY
eukprot:scaffold2510_cov169-Amphora_coffeaeformis.AAC.7